MQKNSFNIFNTNQHSRAVNNNTQKIVVDANNKSNINIFKDPQNSNIPYNNVFNKIKDNRNENENQTFRQKEQLKEQNKKGNPFMSIQRNQNSKSNIFLKQQNKNMNHGSIFSSGSNNFKIQVSNKIAQQQKRDHKQQNLESNQKKQQNLKHNNDNKTSQFFSENQEILQTHSPSNNTQKINIFKQQINHGNTLDNNRLSSDLEKQYQISPKKTSQNLKPITQNFLTNQQKRNTSKQTIKEPKRAKIKIIEQQKIDLRTQTPKKRNQQFQKKKPQIQGLKYSKPSSYQTIRQRSISFQKQKVFFQQDNSQKQIQIIQKTSPNKQQQKQEKQVKINQFQKQELQTKLQQKNELKNLELSESQIVQSTEQQTHTNVKDNSNQKLNWKPLKEFQTPNKNQSINQHEKQELQNYLKNKNRLSIIKENSFQQSVQNRNSIDDGLSYLNSSQPDIAYMSNFSSSLGNKQKIQIEKKQTFSFLIKNSSNSGSNPIQQSVDINKQKQSKSDQIIANNQVIINKMTESLRISVPEIQKGLEQKNILKSQKKSKSKERDLNQLKQKMKINDYHRNLNEQFQKGPQRKMVESQSDSQSHSHSSFLSKTPTKIDDFKEKKNQFDSTQNQAKNKMEIKNGRLALSTRNKQKEYISEFQSSTMPIGNQRKINFINQAAEIQKGNQIESLQKQNAKKIKIQNFSTIQQPKQNKYFQQKEKHQQEEKIKLNQQNNEVNENISNASDKTVSLDYSKTTQNITSSNNTIFFNTHLKNQNLEHQKIYSQTKENYLTSSDVQKKINQQNKFQISDKEDLDVPDSCRRRSTANFGQNNNIESIERSSKNQVLQVPKLKMERTFSFQQNIVSQNDLLFPKNIQHKEKQNSFQENPFLENQLPLSNNIQIEKKQKFVIQKSKNCQKRKNNEQYDTLQESLSIKNSTKVNQSDQSPKNKNSQTHSIINSPGQKSISQNINPKDDYTFGKEKGKSKSKSNTQTFQVPPLKDFKIQQKRSQQIKKDNLSLGNGVFSKNHARRQNSSEKKRNTQKILVEQQQNSKEYQKELWQHKYQQLLKKKDEIVCNIPRVNGIVVTSKNKIQLLKSQNNQILFQNNIDQIKNTPYLIFNIMMETFRHQNTFKLLDKKDMKIHQIQKENQIKQMLLCKQLYITEKSIKKIRQLNQRLNYIQIDFQKQYNQELIKLNNQKYKIQKLKNQSSFFQVFNLKKYKFFSQQEELQKPMTLHKNPQKSYEKLKYHLNQIINKYKITSNKIKQKIQFLNGNQKQKYPYKISFKCSSKIKQKKINDYKQIPSQLSKLLRKKAKDLKQKKIHKCKEFSSEKSFLALETKQVKNINKKNQCYLQAKYVKQWQKIWKNIEFESFRGNQKFQSIFNNFTQIETKTYKIQTQHGQNLYKRLQIQNKYKYGQKIMMLGYENMIKGPRQHDIEQRFKESGNSLSAKLSMLRRCQRIGKNVINRQPLVLFKDEVDQ